MRLSQKTTIAIRLWYETSSGNGDRQPFRADVRDHANGSVIAYQRWGIDVGHVSQSGGE